MTVAECGGGGEEEVALGGSLVAKGLRGGVVGERGSRGSEWGMEGGRVAVGRGMEGEDGRWLPPPRQGGMRFFGGFPWLKPWALCPVPFRDPWETACPGVRWLDTAREGGA